MRYVIYTLTGRDMRRQTIRTLPGNRPVSQVARKLAELAFLEFGNARQVIDDGSLTGHYRNAAGDTMACEHDWSRT